MSIENYSLAALAALRWRGAENNLNVEQGRENETRPVAVTGVIADDGNGKELSA